MKRFLIWMKKPHNGIIIDRRARITCWSTVMLIFWIGAWGMLSSAVADTVPATREQALTQGDLVKAQWWLIAGLLGLVQAIFGAFLIYIVSGVKGDVRKLFSLHENSLTKDGHDYIDHSQLCAVCRTAELKMKGHGR